MRAFDVSILGLIGATCIFFCGVFLFEAIDRAKYRRAAAPVRHDQFCGSSWEAWGELHLCSLPQHHDGNHACQEFHPGWPLRCVEKIERQPVAVEKSFMRGRRYR